MAFIYKENKNELIVNDPIHGEIIVPYPFSKIVLTKEMQRLAHISQNGFSQLEWVCQEKCVSFKIIMKKLEFAGVIYRGMK